MMRACRGDVQASPVVAPEGLAELPFADNRFKALIAGLEQLTNSELIRLRHHVVRKAPLVLDECNFDPGRQLWCPLAVGLDIPRMVGVAEASSLTNRRAKSLIASVGKARDAEFTTNPIRGVRGRFFTTRRHRDLLLAIEWLVAARG